MKTADIVAVARTLVGARYRHQGRGMSYDCAGVPVEVARRLGLEVQDVTGYGKQPVPHVMKALLDQHLERAPKDSMQPGDVAWIRFSGDPQHLAIVANYHLGGLSLIHAYNGAGLSKVVEHRLDETWHSRIVAVWRFPGVEA